MNPIRSLLRAALAALVWLAPGAGRADTMQHDLRIGTDQVEFYSQVGQSFTAAVNASPSALTSLPYVGTPLTNDAPDNAAHEGSHPAGARLRVEMPMMPAPGGVATMFAGLALLAFLARRRRPR